jgi:hypothetical protein
LSGFNFHYRFCFPLLARSSFIFHYWFCFPLWILFSTRLRRCLCFRLLILFSSTCFWFSILEPVRTGYFFHILSRFTTTYLNLLNFFAFLLWFCFRLRITAAIFPTSFHYLFCFILLLWVSSAGLVFVRWFGFRLPLGFVYLFCFILRFRAWFIKLFLSSW